MFAHISVTPGYPGVFLSAGFLTLPPCPPGSVLFILALACTLQKQIFKYPKAKLGSALIWFLPGWLPSAVTRPCYPNQPSALSPHEDAEGCLSPQRQGCLMLWHWTGLSCWWMIPLCLKWPCGQWDGEGLDEFPEAHYPVCCTDDFSPLSYFFPKISYVLTNKCNQDAEGINQDQKDFLDLVVWTVNLWSAFLRVTGRLQSSCVGCNGCHINPGCYTAG